jgi:hypothetical protein
MNYSQGVFGSCTIFNLNSETVGKMALVAYCGSGEGGVWRTLFPCWAFAEDNGDLKEDGHMEGALPYEEASSQR